MKNLKGDTALNFLFLLIKKETNSWITNEIKNAMVKRDCLFRKCVENPNSKNYIEYENQRNVVTQKIRLAKRKLISKN